MFRILRVDAANLRGFGDTRDCQHVCGQAQITGVLSGLVRDGGVGAVHYYFQLLGDFFDAPEESLQVLHPFKVAYGHTARIRQNVGNDQCAFFEENGVGLRRGGAIRRFGDDTRLHAISIGRSDDALGSSRDENVARHFQHFLHADRLRARETDHAATLLLEAQHSRRIKPGLVINAAARIADSYDLAPFFMEEAGGNRTGITIPLNAHARAFERHTDMFRRLAGHKQDACSGGIVTAFAAADRKRLARDDRRDGVALVHGIGIHDPGHHLRVGVDIRRGNIAVRANDDRNFGSIAAGEPFKFRRTHALGVADDAALRAAIGDADDRAFPGHPHRQRLDLVECDLRAIANATFGRTTIDVMLYTIACKGLDATIIQAYRKIHCQFALGFAQYLAHIFG